MSARKTSILTALICLLAPVLLLAQPTLTVGSKNFNENYILGEVIAQLFEDRGYDVSRNFGMTGTSVSFAALRSGDIDVYVEYTGTLAQSILDYSGDPTSEVLNSLLVDDGVEILSSFGFNNTYALTMKAELAAQLGIRSVSELAALDDISYGFSLEFLNRNDGWLGLIQSYGFDAQPRKSVV